mmetsp:Transcript_27049/g.50567  ORF Transcript_27049/g.50567 Transcript_27049/m.50567 type:complete len:287 (-) Transcript_27049:97-957(-)
MEGDLVLPTPHAQYSTLPHKNTFKVEDNLGVIWDEVISAVCDEYNMKFNPMFMKNPLHLVFKFISQTTYLLEMVLPYADALQNNSSLTNPEPVTTSADTDNTLHDVNSFIRGFPKSISALNSGKAELSIEEDDLNAFVDLCTQVAITVKSPLFQKYEPFTHDITTVMNNIISVFSNFASPIKGADASIISPAVNRAYRVDKIIFNKKRKAEDGTPVSAGADKGDESHETGGGIVLCLPCAPSAVAVAVAGASGGGKRKWERRSWGGDDAFSRPNRHVYNGYCPCCD